MIKINLLSEGKRPVVARRAKQPTGGARTDIGNALLVAGIVLGLLVAGGWWYMLDREIKKKDREIAAAQKEVDELAQVIKEVEEYKAKKAELERKINVINQRLGYLVRSGSPDALDSIVPMAFGNLALDLILDGVAGRLVNIRNGRYDNVPIDVVTSRKKVVDVAKHYVADRLRPRYENFENQPVFIMTSDY